MYCKYTYTWYFTKKLGLVNGQYSVQPFGSSIFVIFIKFV